MSDWQAFSLADLIALRDYAAREASEWQQAHQEATSKEEADEDWRYQNDYELLMQDADEEIQRRIKPLFRS